VSTRQESEERVAPNPSRVGKPGRLGVLEPAEAVALVACSGRERLLAIHQRRLAHEDLEDCYSQATLELLNRARHGEAFASYAHIANALQQRLLSRIHDRRRALSGRSPIEAAIATAVPFADCENGGVEIADVRANVERLALVRHDLQRIGQAARQLSADQRLVLASQLSGDIDCGEFCRIHGWSRAKYRKVAQRARARLIRLLGESLTGQANPFVPFAVTRRIREQGPTYDNPSPHI
jgi:DNA-directed RNA polymerase specialized sigma24 family protein